MPSKRNFKFIGIVLLLIGFCLGIVNFFSPHAVLTETFVDVPSQSSPQNELPLNSKYSFILDSNTYNYFYPVAIKAGQTFKMTWDSSNPVTACILTQDQFVIYRSNQIFYTVIFQATESGKSGTLTYYVPDSDNYVALVVNAGGLFGGSSTAVLSFTESVISYTGQPKFVIRPQTTTQIDSLYLSLGFLFIITGIVVFFVFWKAFPNRNTQLLRKT